MMRCQGQDVEAGVPEQSIFIGAGARILNQVELESEQRYCRIAPSSRSSHLLLAFLYHCF